MSSLAIVCDRCHLVAYCSKGCQEEALPVHRVECEGLVKVEQARGKCKYNTTAECTRDLYWPPSIALVVARALNRKVLEWKGYEEWEISFLARPEKLPPLKESGFKNLVQFMWPLVLRSIITEEMLYDTYCKIALNASQSSALSGVSAMAVYTNFSLFNHCCVPNCAWKMENGVKIVYTLKDIEKGEELCISYISDIHRLLPGNFRREKLMSVFGFECRCSVCVDEKVSGSASWFLEHQKKSFIAPWSHKTAEVAMQEGKNALMKLIQLRVDGDWAKVAEIAQVALKCSKGILRDKNIFRYLLSRYLLEAYWMLDRPMDALQISDVVLKSVEEYELSLTITEVLSQIGGCHFKVGNVQKGCEFTEKSMRHFPVKMTAEELGASLKSQEVSCILVKSVDEIYHKFQASTSAKDQSGKIDVSKLFS